MNKETKSRKIFIIKLTQKTSKINRKKKNNLEDEYELQ